MVRFFQQCSCNVLLCYRRAHLKECFDNLKQQVPNMEDKKTSNLSILRGALRYIQVNKPPFPS